MQQKATVKSCIAIDIQATRSALLTGPGSPTRLAVSLQVVLHAEVTANILPHYCILCEIYRISWSQGCPYRYNAKKSRRTAVRVRGRIES